MKRDRAKDILKTAAELIAELQKDPAYNMRARQREAEQRRNVDDYARAAAPLLQDLAAHGIQIKAVAELRSKRESFLTALPFLLKWLPVITQPQVRSDLVNTLATPWASPVAAKPLIKEFKREAADSDESIRWAIGNALSFVADDSVREAVTDLVCDKRYGRSREMLAVALANMSPDRVFPILVSLLDDEELVGHAIIGLAKLKLPAARPYFQKYIDHPKQWVREEAIRAL